MDEDLVQVLQIELQTKNEKIKSLEKEIRLKDQKLSTHEKDIDFLEQRLDKAYGELSDKERELYAKDRELSAKDGRIEILEFQLTEARAKPPQATAVLSRPITVGDNQFVWKKGPKTPKPVSAGSASTIGDKGYVYCSNGDVFEFDTKKELWTTLPPCPFTSSTIVTVTADFILTAIGGMNDANTETNMLASWVNGNWKCGFYPSMPTKRYRATAMCDDQYLIVAGGCYGEEKLSVVELMWMNNIQWYMCRSLPYPLGGGSMVTIGTDSVYIVGGSARDVFQRLSILKCSLDELWTTSLRHTVHNMTMQLAYKNPPPCIWHKATDLPVQYATCALIRDKIYIIGGEGTEGKHFPVVYLYKHETDRLESVGQMLVGRSWSQVMVFPNNKIVVAGGETDSGVSDEVEIAEVKVDGA